MRRVRGGLDLHVETLRDRQRFSERDTGTNIKRVSICLEYIYTLRVEGEADVVGVEHLQHTFLLGSGSGLGLGIESGSGSGSELGLARGRGLG